MSVKQLSFLTLFVLFKSVVSLRYDGGAALMTRDLSRFSSSTSSVSSPSNKEEDEDLVQDLLSLINCVEVRIEVFLCSKKEWRFMWRVYNHRSLS